MTGLMLRNGYNYHGVRCLHHREDASPMAMRASTPRATSITSPCPERHLGAGISAAVVGHSGHWTSPVSGAFTSVVQAETSAAELIANPELQHSYLGVEGAGTLKRETS